MYQAPHVELIKDNQIRVLHPDPIEPKTNLIATVAAAGTSLTVKNNAGLAQNDAILLEAYGIANAEIAKVDASVSAGTALTSTALKFAHGLSAELRKILFNKIEISGASTVGGSKTVIATVDIRVSQPYTDYVVSGTTYAYYFARFYNDIVASPYYGAYCDAIGSDDFDEGSVGFMRSTALENIGETANEKFNARWCYKQIYLCELDILKEKAKWSQLRVDNYDLGNASTGEDTYALPSNLADQKTDKSIFGVRFGTSRNLDFVDKADFKRLREGSTKTTLASAILTNDTTVTLTDSRDFADSGSINIAGTEYSYTSNNRSTGVLSGFTAFSSGISNGTNVWQGMTFGEPKSYTIIEGYLIFDVPFADTLNGRNIWLDYYKKATKPNSDGDLPIFDNPLLYINWIEMAVKKKKNGGVLPSDDTSAAAYVIEKNKLLVQDKNVQGLRLTPMVPVSLGRRRSTWLR